MTPLLLLAACAPPTDAGPATTLPVDWGEEGSRLVAWGVAGVFVSDAAGAVFSPLTTDPPWGVAAAADTVTTWSAEGARVFHLADGGAATSQAFGCDTDEWLGHALFDGERTWGVCDGDDRAGRLLRAGADGAALDTAVPADRVVADQGAFYLALERFGYDISDGRAAVAAFQRRWRPELIDGEIDGQLGAILFELLLERDMGLAR